MAIDSICVAGIREDAALLFCFSGNHPDYQTDNHLSGEQNIVSTSLDHSNHGKDAHFRHLINPLNRDRAFNNINRAGLAQCLGKFIFNPGNRPWSPLIFGHDQTFAANPLEFPSRDPWSETSGTTMTTEQEQQKNVFKELFKIELEASSLSIKEISKDDQVLSYYLEQNKDGTKKGITLKKSDFGKLKPIFQEISEK